MEKKWVSIRQNSFYGLFPRAGHRGGGSGGMEGGTGMLLLAGPTGHGCAIVLAEPELLRPLRGLPPFGPALLPSCSLQDEATLGMV